MLALELARHESGHGLARLPASTAVLVGMLVLIAFASEGIWLLARHISVIAHEGAHALAGWSVGHKVVSMNLNSDATGETGTVGPNGLGGIIIAFAGYLGPSLFGLGAALLIAQDHVQAVLWLGLIFLVIPLLLVRNFFGIVSVTLSGVLLFLILHYGSPGIQTVAAYGLSWVLLFSGVRVVFMRGSNAADAGLLGDMTIIPRFVWSALWLVGAIAALWVGGHLLV